jgi:predicted MFS family arabinose efflux permease
MAFNVTGHSIGRALGALLATFLYRSLGFGFVTLLSMLFNVFGLLALRRLAQGLQAAEA